MKKLLMVSVMVAIAICTLGLTACGGVQNFNLSFVVDDEIYATIETTGNESISIPNNPEKDGYIFDGWFWDDGVWEKPFTANSLLDAPISSDMKVYAKFSQEHTHNYTETVVEPTYTEQGYTLHTCSCGDSYKDNYTDKLVSGLTFKTLTLNSDNTVYGKVANGTSSFSFLNEITVNGSVTYTVCKDIYGQLIIPSKTVALTTGDNTFYVLADSTENGLVLYTVTIRVKPMYTVSFNTLGGGNVANQTIEEDSKAIEPTSNPTKTGYTFKGWDFDFTTPVIENKMVKAIWQANTYELTFDGNGVAGPAKRNITYNSTYGTLPTLERFGYTFKGWTTTRDGSSYVYSSNIVKTINNRTLYAKWETMLSYALNSAGTEYSVTDCDTEPTKAEILSEINSIPVTSIGESAFSECSSLESITIPNSVTSIGWYAFYGCSNLKTVTFEANSKLKSIGERAFYKCSSLTSIEIPSSVTSIGWYAFYGCSNLKTVTFEANSKLKSIGERAFYKCSSLTSIEIPSSVTSIGSDAFYGCYSLIQKDNGVYYVDKLVIDCETNITMVTLRENTVVIASSAFKDCSSLTSIEIPNSVTSIGSDAFYGCYKLVEVVNLSPSITITKGSSNNGYVGYFALRVLTEAPTTSNFSNIDGYSFYNYESNYYLTGYNGSETDLTLPTTDFDYSIYQYVFYECSSLTSIKIPSSVTSIGYEAFYGCYSLGIIIYKGTIAQWNAIRKGSYWNSDTGNYRIFCTDGDIPKT